MAWPFDGSNIFSSPANFAKAIFDPSGALNAIGHGVENMFGGQPQGTGQGPPILAQGAFDGPPGSAPHINGPYVPPAPHDGYMDSPDLSLFPMPTGHQNAGDITGLAGWGTPPPPVPTLKSAPAPAPMTGLWSGGVGGGGGFGTGAHWSDSFNGKDYRTQDAFAPTAVGAHTPGVTSSTWTPQGNGSSLWSGSYKR